jgi:glycosyltransferase involved in cell wall biosynthesis
MIADEAVNIDAFISPSQYYKDLFIAKTGIKGSNIYIVPSGIESPRVFEARKNNRLPAIGYYCRINYQNGFDKLIDAFIDIKLLDKIPGLTLHVSGGFTGDDQPFINKQLKKLKKHGLRDSVKIYDEFQGPPKEEFFSNIDIMSVPVRKFDAYGLYILEANAAGVAVVQPATGAFPEILEKTGGGILYSPDNKGELIAGIIKLFNDKQLMHNLGETGRIKVKEELTLEKMSVGLSKVYSDILA